MTETVQRALLSIQPQDFTWLEQEAIRDIIEGKTPWFTETEAQSIIDQIEPGGLFLLTAFKKVLALRIKEKEENAPAAQKPLAVVPFKQKSSDELFNEDITLKVLPCIARKEYGAAGDNLIELCSFYGRNPYSEANKLSLRLPLDKKELTKVLAKNTGVEKTFTPRFLTIFGLPGELPKIPLFINGKQIFNPDNSPQMVSIDRYELEIGNRRISLTAGDREVGLAHGKYDLLVEIVIASMYLNQRKDQNGRRDPVLYLGATKGEFCENFGKHFNGYYEGQLIEALYRVFNTTRTIHVFDNSGKVVGRDLVGVKIGDLYGRYSKTDAEKHPDWVGVAELSEKYIEYLEKNFLYLDMTIIKKLFRSERDLRIYLFLVNKLSYLQHKKSEGNEIPLTVSYDEIALLYNDEVKSDKKRVENIKKSISRVVERSKLNLQIDISSSSKVIIALSTKPRLLEPKKRSSKKPSE